MFDYIRTSLAWDASAFHFAYPEWLWALLLLPLGIIAILASTGKTASMKRMAAFADAHLLPHLLSTPNTGKQGKGFWIIAWSLLWTSAVLAMAGPRWDYVELETYRSDASLIIVLDLSNSMNVEDVKPSRIARAKQEIEDLLTLAKGVNIGLVAFAGVPHMIVPLTDDTETILHLLPSLNTDLVYLQGSELEATLKMASRLLEVEAGENKAILVISDGGFKGQNVQALVDTHVDPAIRIHTMGLGTTEGAPIPDGKGSWYKDQGKTVVSGLEVKDLQVLAQAGNGTYIEANYTESDSRKILELLVPKATFDSQEVGKKRFWEERFYFFIAVMIAMLLPVFRKGYQLPVWVALIYLMSGTNAYAADTSTQIDQWFLNPAQQGQKSLQKQDYDHAEATFSDPYRKGVAAYKAGRFDQAEKWFEQSERPDIAADAQYNLGNSLLMQGKLDEAIETYESLLEDYPDHEDAKHNLEVAKQAQKKQPPKKQKKKDKQDQKKKDKQQDQKNQSSQKNKQDSQKDQKQKNQKQQDQQKDQQKKDKQDKQNKQQSSKKQKQQQKQSGDKQPKESQTGGDKETQPSGNAPQSKGAKQPQKQDAKKQPKKDAPTNQQRSDASNKQTSEKRKQAAKQPKPSMKQGQEKGDRDPGQSKEKGQKAQKGKARNPLDIEADQWLNRLETDSERILKNQFYVEGNQSDKKGWMLKPW